MSITRYTIPIPTGAASGATALSEMVQSGGLLEAIRLVRPSTGQISTVANLRVTGDISGIELFSATATSTGSQTWFPRSRIVNTSGAPLNNSTAASAPPLVDKIPIGQEQLRVVVASGGANASGVLHIYMSSP